MITSECVDKIAPALHAAQSEVGKVGKDAENTFDRYKYATLESNYKACRRVMQSHGLLVTETVCARRQIEGRKAKGGSDQYACSVEIELTIMHTSGQWVRITSVGEGQDRADKATYKAITGARKYGIAMAMNLVTSDDPEADEKVGLGADYHTRPAASAPPQPRQQTITM